MEEKSQPNDVPLSQISSSTNPLVSTANINKEDKKNDYDPFEHRIIEHPTSDTETFIHLLKGCLGSGILAMPFAFLNAGLIFGLIATVIIGIICTYCVHVLVKNAHKLCYRMRIPSLGFADVAEIAILAGPPALHKYAKIFKGLVNAFIITDLLGCCCVYINFVANNIKQVGDWVYAVDLDVRWYMVMMWPLLILMNLIRNLKHLAPFSMIANFLIGTSIIITLWYVLQDLPPVNSVPFISDWRKWPLFFGTAIFALEGIGVVMPLENNMKSPKNFIGCPSVLNFGMTIVVISYSTVGFFGYLKYGNESRASLTLNLPEDELLAQSVKVMIAIAIFFTYSLQFYVPFQVIWNLAKDRTLAGYELFSEYVLRILLVTCTVVFSIIVPFLGPIISLVGALCLSFLGLILPSCIDLLTIWENPGFGRGNWRLWKNLVIMSFGVLGLVTGVYTSILDIFHIKY